MRTAATFLMLACAASLAGAQAGSEADNVRTYRLRWSDLDGRIRGSTVQLTLPSRIELAGTVLSVEADELRLDVRDTSDKRAYPKGLATVPRAEVRRLRVIETSHTGTAVGAGIGGGLGCLIAWAGASEGWSWKTKVGVLAIPTLLGALVGAGADARKTDIVIEAEGEAPPLRPAVSTRRMPLPAWVGQPVVE